jgi:copper homeostasis protein
VTVLIEACVDSVASAVAAEWGGSQRLELCENLGVGGTTPSTELIDAVRARVGIPIMVMIRPRGGSYVHCRAELDQMRRDIGAAKEHGADGVVLGVLDAANRVDVKATNELVTLAADMPVTFHRAFDIVPDLSIALEALVTAGVARVLTSGGAPTALAGAPMLASLVRRAGERIRIMAGGKVRGGNVREIAATSGVTEVHARCELDSAQIRAIASALDGAAMR